MKIDLEEVARKLDQYPDNVYANIKIEIERYGQNYALKLSFTSYIGRGFEEGRQSEEFYTLEDALRFIQEMYETHYKV